MNPKETLLFSCMMAVMLLWSITPCAAADKDIDICSLVTQDQLSHIYRKPLFPKEYRHQCLWSKTAGGMAYFDIQYHKYKRPLREYFNKKLSDIVILEKIDDLGDEGLMTIVEGSLGVIVIRKGDWVLQSAVTFLDIEPGTDKQKILWDIYREILKQL